MNSLRDDYDRIRALLDSSPLACRLWNRDFEIFEINKETLRLFQVKDEKEFKERFFDLSPEFQPDGQRSRDKARILFDEAFRSGGGVYEWMHQTLDGTPIPAEITLVRVPFEDDFIIATHTRDLREHQKLMNEISRRDTLLRTANQIANILLTVRDDDDFDAELMRSMEIVCRSMDGDRFQIWRNEMIGGELCFVQIYICLSEAGKATPPVPKGLTLSYRDRPGWEETFLRDEYINSPVSGLPEDSREVLKKYEVKSIVMIPLYLEGEFWGFISLDNCRVEREFTDEEIDILRSMCLLIANAIDRRDSAARMRDVHERSMLLLDSMPLSCRLWNREMELLDCNEESARLFNLKDKQEVMSRYFEYYPEFQPDGKKSRETAYEYIQKAFDEGRFACEWMHKTPDGDMIPSEVTLVRVPYGDDYAVAGYTRDLREHKKMMNELERRDALMNTVNNVATVLLRSGVEVFVKDLHRCLGMFANAVDVGRIAIWQNQTQNGKLYYRQVFEWRTDVIMDESADYSMSDFCGVKELRGYDEVIPGWEAILSNGAVINSVVNDLSPGEQVQLNRQGILSIFASPVFIQDNFWGFVSFYNYRSERVFTENEQIIMRSGSLVIANALLHYNMMQNIRESAAKLEAVISNYAGIIWSADRNGIITLLNGLYIKRLGLEPGYYEGTSINDIQEKNEKLGIITNVHKTYGDGPHDMVCEDDGIVFHAHITPITGVNGETDSVVGTLEDITEITRLQKELEIALKEAKRANNAKSDFLANMSHEMRTPLNAVIGLSGLSLENDEMDWDTYSNLEKIYNAGETLLSIVNDVLDISKIEAGKFELVEVAYDVPSLINDSVTQNILRIGGKPIEFTLDVKEDMYARLIGDELRIKQIINNLLSNAFKYTREGVVELSVYCEQAGGGKDADGSIWLVIEIRDTGSGIHPEDIDRLFVDYTKLDLESNRKIEGTGLGLPITKKLSEMMGGEISVESEFGTGSTFRVRVRQKIVSDERLGPSVVRSLKSFRYSEKKRDSSKQSVRMSLPYARVLVVDDNPTNLDVAKGLMKPYKMQVDCVTSGQEAIDAIREGAVRYDAVFMDHMMPGMDGTEAVRFIREIDTDYARNLPVIAFTANAIAGSRQHFINAGFQDFLSKPINISKLDEIIRSWIRDKEKEKSLAENETPEVVQDQNDSRLRNFQITGLDVARGIERFNGDVGSYLDVLRSYASSTGKLLDSITDVSKYKNTLSDYAITVHGIKGSSRGIFAGIAGNSAEALEKAARAGDYSFVTKNNAKFIESARKLVNDIEDMLLVLDAENSKPKKDRPDPGLLTDLAAACEEFDINKADGIISELDNYEYENDSELMNWLKDKVENGLFEDVKEKIAMLKDKGDI